MHLCLLYNFELFYFITVFAVVAQLVEHDIGNIEVIGSIPINGSEKLLLIWFFQIKG